MRQDKYDIRQFNLKQLTTFIKEVGDTQPEDLSVFKNYVDAAIVQNFFTEEDLKANIGSLADLLHTYALNAAFEDGAAMFKFIVGLKA